MSENGSPFVTREELEKIQVIRDIKEYILFLGVFHGYNYFEATQAAIDRYEEEIERYNLEIELNDI